MACRAAKTRVIYQKARSHTSFAALFQTLPRPSRANQRDQKGLDAAQSGDFATVLREWKPLAEQGEVNAQLVMGFMYRDVRGLCHEAV